MKRTRIVVVAIGVLSFDGLLLVVARRMAGFVTTWWLALASACAATVFILTLGSLYEWIVHRFVYHHPSPLRLLDDIHEIHVRGHHWHRFPPDRYVTDGPIERIPAFPADPLALCGSTGKRSVAWLAQFALYLTVGVPLAFVPAWFVTQNVAFTASAIVSGVVVCYLFIRVHDVMHYPSASWIERQRWFVFLDRHHYVHHIDNAVNLNFLLPLCDLLFGTMKLRPTAGEAKRWPTFEDAKRMPAAPSTSVDPGEVVTELASR
jgi:hypothetical protein